MCINFSDLNEKCPKDPYPLLSIDKLIDRASCFHVLSFMDAYAGYKQIMMNPNEDTKIMFMTNHNN